MIGYHEFKTFYFSRADADAGIAMPINWKPISMHVTGTDVIVGARKWHNGRSDKDRPKYLGVGERG